MAIEKNQIIHKALELLSRDGLEGLTLRRLASELDIKAASIYWHIPNKSVLLDEMANAILEQHFHAYDFQNEAWKWEEWLDTFAHELRAALRSYRDGGRVVAGTHPDLGQVLIQLWDFTIRILHKAGFAYGAAATVTITVMNFTFGAVIEEQSTQPPATGPKMQRDQLPLALQAALAEWDSGNEDLRFDTGVWILIQGVRAALNAQNSRLN